MRAPHQHPDHRPDGRRTDVPQDDPVPGATAYQHLTPPPHALTARPPAGTVPSYQPRHRAFRIAGTALVGLLVALGAVSTVPEMVRDAEDEVFALPDDLVELDLQGDAGEVVVREVAAGQPTGITVSKHWSFREPTVDLDSSAGVLSASLDCPEAAFLGRCYGHWTVAVPEGTRVVVRASVGDVDVADVTGEVTVHGSVGDVRVGGAPTRLDVSTSVGGIDVALEEPAASVRLRTSVGDVDLRLPDGAVYDVRTTSPLDPAKVAVETSTDSEHDVDVSSSVGSVVITEG